MNIIIVKNLRICRNTEKITKFAEIEKNYTTVGLEIERKFIAKYDFDYSAISESVTEICQGYLSNNPDATVRVRISGEKAFLTVKGRNQGMTRKEWEYAIPLEDAREMLELAVSGRIEKTRLRIPFKNLIWEVDVFHGALDGLVLAEVELDSETEDVSLPAFIVREVTGNPEYYNSNLSSRIP